MKKINSQNPENLFQIKASYKGYLQNATNKNIMKLLE